MPSTKLPAPVTVERDYSRWPIPGQLALFPRCPEAAHGCAPRDLMYGGRVAAGVSAGNNETDAAWLRRMLDTHGHGGL